MREYRIKTNHIELQVREYEHCSEAIIFLHFGGANLVMWQPVVPFFQAKYRLVLLDLRGHGKSEAPPHGYHMDDMALDVAGVLDQLTISRAHVLGSSLGAEVGLSLAANHPEKVLSLVCDGAISSEYGPYSTWQGSQAEFNQHVRQFLEKLGNTPEKIYPSLQAKLEQSREGLQQVGWWNDDVEEMERYGTQQLEQGGFVNSFRKFARQEYFAHYFSSRFEEYYPRVKCPLLLVAGDDAFEHQPEHSAMFALAGLAPQAQVVRVNGWQHPYGWMIDPQAMCAVVLKFLATRPG